MNVKPNTYIVGDNLAVLRGMDSGIVDLVVLDPPFNSGETYASPMGGEQAAQSFDDAWRWSDLNVRWLAEISEQCEALSKVIAAARLSQPSKHHATAAYLAFMGVRLLEVRRVMKASGSIYLHCDDTANAYLRQLLDCVFGHNNFKNEIIWRRNSGGKSSSRQFPRNHDVIYHYAGVGATFNPQTIPHAPDSEYVRSAYRHDDGDGRGLWTPDRLMARGVRNGPSGKSWRGINPTDRHQHWFTPTQGAMKEYIVAHDLIPGWPHAYKTPQEKLDAMDAAGLIHWSKGGLPYRKQYLAAVPGLQVDDIWTDIKRLTGQSAEKNEWLTQKPWDLVRRMIRASTNPGDLVLDPFAGCATTCCAAALEGRNWIGIDIDPAGPTVVREQLLKANPMGEIGTTAPEFTPRISRTVPVRTDDPAPKPRRNSKTYRTRDNIKLLYGEQMGYCPICTGHYEIRQMHVDHVKPRSKGGTDDVGNLQLLCAGCNLLKGTETNAIAKERLRRHKAGFTESLAGG